MRNNCICLNFLHNRQSEFVALKLIFVPNGSFWVVVKVASVELKGGSSAAIYTQIRGGRKSKLSSISLYSKTPQTTTFWSSFDLEEEAQSSSVKSSKEVPNSLTLPLVCKNSNTFNYISSRHSRYVVAIHKFEIKHFWKCARTTNMNFVCTTFD